MEGRGRLASAPRSTLSDDERFRRAWGDRERVIVVPLDGSTDSTVCLFAAREVASVVRATIHIAFLTTGEVGTEEPSGPRECDLALALGLSRDGLHGAVVESVEAGGDVAAAIRDRGEARKAMISVAAAYPAGPRMGPLDPASVRRLIEMTATPILLVRPEVAARLRQHTTIRRLLVPLDGEPSSAAGITPAIDLARRACADLDILFVEAGEARVLEPGGMGAPRFVDQPQHEWRQWSSEFISRFGTALGQCAEVSGTHLFLRRGDPAEEIRRFAEERDEDLIIISWHGPTESRRAEVAHRVIATAPCPVLLLRAPAAASAANQSAD